ncbi:hypothetical protein QUA41_28650 [Microcoleus sp. Pol11C1]|uniref:hypothetical protein n=1 Tax=unclassified Microcoleus TaxID=2642155 RepID=UPI002FD6039A
MATQPLFLSNIDRNPDVDATQGFFKSAFEHFMNFGMVKNRVGAVIVGSSEADRLERNASANIFNPF